MYSLSNEHDVEWADVEDLVPEPPEIPDALRPFYPTGETVEHVEDLQILAFNGEAPYFARGEPSVEATPQEMAEWRAAWAEVTKAQQAFRARLKKAQEAYDAAAREALADLAEATQPWLAVEATLKARAAELAAKVHAHRTAAKEYMAKREAKEQEHLDTIHGPRVIVLYKPKSLSSQKQADHIARVHLVTCKRRAELPAPVGQSLPDDEGLRANEAWHRLTHPDEWIRSVWGDVGKNMRVKFCSFCKPWTVFEEHIDGFPRPRYNGRMNPVLGDLRLTDLPETWTNSLRSQED
jgi:hypothetical protein